MSEIKDARIDGKSISLIERKTNLEVNEKLNWHYIKDNDLPTIPGEYYIAYVIFPNNWCSYDVTFYEKNSDKAFKWINHLNDVVAWTEIPKLDKEVEKELLK